MNASEKKFAMANANRILMAVLDTLPIPDAVIDYSKLIISREDHRGWYVEGESCFDVHCCACQKTFKVLERPRPRKSQNCHWCTAAIKVRRQNQSQRFYINTKHHFCHFQKDTDGTIVVRYFNNTRLYTDRDYVLNIAKNLIEYQRIVFRPDGVRRFIRNSWWHVDHGEPTWRQAGQVAEYVSAFDVPQTKATLQNVFTGTYLEKSHWLDMDGGTIFGLYKFVTWPALEYLYKLGYEELVHEIIYGRNREDKTLNLYKKRCNEVLGVPHSILQKYEHKDLKERDIKAIKQIIEFGRLGQLTLDRFKFIQSILTNNSLNPLDVFRNFGVEKVINYIKKQADIKTEQENKQAGRYVIVHDKTVWNDFQDYRLECHALGYDLTDEGVLFPRDLYVAHERTSELVREQKVEKEITKYADHYAAAIKGYLPKEFVNEQYIIRIAKTPEEIIQEGARLKHCVGSYYKRVAEKRCLIFFIRAITSPDKPLYTLEVHYKTKSIIQCRGFGNKSAPADVFKFIEESFKKKAV